MSMDPNRDLAHVLSTEPDDASSGSDAGGVQGSNADDPAVRGMFRGEPPGVAPTDESLAAGLDAGGDSASERLAAGETRLPGQGRTGDEGR